MNRLYAAVWGEGRRGEVFPIPQPFPILELAKPLKPRKMSEDVSEIPSPAVLVERTKYEPFGKIENKEGKFAVILYSTYEGNFIEMGDLKTVAGAVEAGIV